MLLLNSLIEKKNLLKETSCFTCFFWHMKHREPPQGIKKVTNFLQDNYKIAKIGSKLGTDDSIIREKAAAFCKQIEEYIEELNLDHAAILDSEKALDTL